MTELRYRDTEIDVVLGLLSAIVKKTRNTEIRVLACTAYNILAEKWPYDDHTSEIVEKCREIINKALEV